MSSDSAHVLKKRPPRVSYCGGLPFLYELQSIFRLQVYIEKMTRILVVQSRTSSDWLEREQKNFRRVIGDLAEIEFLSALDERLAWSSPDEFLKNADGVIFGGSSDFDFDGGRTEEDPARLTSLIILARTKNIVQHAISAGTPVLGVCFGHQLIARMYEGEVRHDAAQGKQGSHEIHLTGHGVQDRLFKDFPPAFVAQYWHKDSVTNLPKGAMLLATGPTCLFSVLRYGDNVYTVQFHPEVERIIIDTHARPSPEASRLVPLWIEHIVGQ